MFCSRQAFPVKSNACEKGRRILKCETPEMCFTRVGFGLTHEHKTRRERSVRDKALAYYERLQILVMKSCITLGQGANHIELSSKLDRFKLSLMVNNVV